MSWNIDYSKTPLKRAGTFYTTTDRRCCGRAMPGRASDSSPAQDGARTRLEAQAYEGFVHRVFVRFTAQCPLHAEVLRLREIEGHSSTSVVSILQRAGFPAISAARVRQIATKETRERFTKIFRELLDEESDPCVRERVERFLRSIG